MSSEQVVVAEGGWDSKRAVESADNICYDCIKTKGDSRWNKRRKRMQFAYDEAGTDKGFKTEHALEREDHRDFELGGDLDTEGDDKKAYEATAAATKVAAAAKKEAFQHAAKKSKAKANAGGKKKQRQIMLAMVPTMTKIRNLVITLRCRMRRN